MVINPLGGQSPVNLLLLVLSFMSSFHRYLCTAVCRAYICYSCIKPVQNVRLDERFTTRDVETTVHLQGMICDLFSSSNCDVAHILQVFLSAPIAL